MSTKKRLIASFLLTAFVINTAYAEKIIFDSYGRPIRSVQTTQKVLTKDTLTIEKNTDKTKESANMENKADKDLLNKYLTRNESELLKSVATVKSITKLEGTRYFASQNGGVASSADIPYSSIKGRVELPWYNGNYIVWNTQMSKGFYFAGEYDSSKNLVGYVVIEKKNGFVRCFEYLFTGDFNIPLSTLSIYYKDKNKAAFIYNANKTLLMYKINDMSEVKVSQKIENPEFLPEIIRIFDNPKKAVKIGKKYSENNARKNIEKRQIPEKDYSYLNYKPEGFKIDLEQAISKTYHFYSENESSVLRTYKLARKHSIAYDDTTMVFAPKYPESFYKAFDLGIIPKYLKPNYYLCINKTMTDSLVEIYDLLVKNDFQERDLANLVYFYKSYHKDTLAVPLSEIKSIVENPSIPKEDKFYYIYGKLAANHYDLPEIEQDIINSIHILKQNPQIVQKGFDESLLKDEILRILNYYPKACRTEEAVKKALAVSAVDNRERFYLVLGKLKTQALKDREEDYPETLYKIAESGIMDFGFSGGKKFFKDEKVLSDVYQSAQILMKNKYWEWHECENGDIFAICPELCMTSKIVSEVINDPSIPSKEKESTIVRRLYKEIYKDFNERPYKIGNNISEDGFRAIEKGYYPKYITDYILIYRQKKLAGSMTAIDLMEVKGFDKQLIKFLLDNIICTHDCDVDKIVKILKQNKTPNDLLKDILLEQKEDVKWKEIISEFFNADLISTNNIDNSLERCLEEHYEEINTRDVLELAKLKNTAVFNEDDINRFMHDIMWITLPYLHTINEKVLNNPSIKPEDRAVFIFALIVIEEEKNRDPDASEECYIAIDEGIGLNYLFPEYKEENIAILNLYKYMKDDLKYYGEEIYKILDYLKCPDRENKIDVGLLESVVRNNNLDYDQKILELEKAAGPPKKVEVQHGKNILKTIGNILWGICIIPVIILKCIFGDWHI